MKKILSFIGLLALTILFPLTASAAPQRLVDYAGLLTAQESQNVIEELDTVSANTGIDVVVLTVDSLGGKAATAYADDFYDANGYADDGCLFLICPETRDFAVSTIGICQKKFKVEALDDIVSMMRLADGDYEGSFLTFAHEINYLYEEVASNGGRGAFHFGRKFIISLIIGLIAGFITYSSLKSQLKSVVAKSGAADYKREGSFKLNEERDYFLYSQTTRTEIPRNDSTGSTGSHVSSSGKTHGGTSGKY